MRIYFRGDSALEGARVTGIFGFVSGSSTLKLGRPDIVEPGCPKADMRQKVRDEFPSADAIINAEVIETPTDSDRTGHKEVIGLAVMLETQEI